MPRNSAFNQARYRERKKLTDINYKLKERERVAKYYVKTADLSNEEREKRRMKGRESMRRQRERKRQKLEEEPASCSNLEPDATSATAGVAQQEPVAKRTRSRELQERSSNRKCPHGEVRQQDLQTKDQDQQRNTKLLSVKFPFQTLKSQRLKTRKRISRAVAVAKRKNLKLRLELQESQRKVWQLQKKLYRDFKQVTNSGPRPTPKYISTPIKVTDDLLRVEGLSPRKVKTVRKTLILHNTLIKHLKASGKMARLNAMNVVGRTRSARLLAKTLKVHRKVRLRTVAKLETKRKVSAAINRRSIGLFFTREDNATCLPGKRDTVKVGSGRMQKYILNDSVGALHKKYNFEYPNMKISLTLFQSGRPKNVLPVSYASRKICLCQRHQNFALRLRVLRSQGVTQSPDHLITSETKESLERKISALPTDIVTFQVWKQVERPYKDTVIKKITLVEENVPKLKFKEDFLKCMNEFRSHSERVRAQYHNLSLLKESLLQTECTVQLDFAENYVCHYFEEVSSAYYSKEQVTVHPTVIHYKTTDGQLQHKSLVVLSDEMAHGAGTVFAFIKVIVEWIKEHLPLIQQMHYLSDSPTSQYRNASIFNLVSLHKSMFNISASWHYFESGHGKGPCDGVGGAVKRAADLAVKKGRLITTASTFYEWGITQTGSAVTYLLVKKDKVKAASLELASLGAVRVLGTMKTHAVMPVDDQIYIRETSCFSPCCWSLGVFHPSCSGWVKTRTRYAHEQRVEFGKRTAEDHEDEASSSEEPPKKTAEETGLDLEEAVKDICVGNFVAVKYNSNVYVGKVEEIDDDEYFITFMESFGSIQGTYRWPLRPDELWVIAEDVLCKLMHPVPTGKSCRAFKLCPADVEFVCNH